MKVVTLCGSMKFQDEMMKIAEKLALDGRMRTYTSIHGNSTS